MTIDVRRTPLTPEKTTITEETTIKQEPTPAPEPAPEPTTTTTTTETSPAGNDKADKAE